METSMLVIIALAAVLGPLSAALLVVRAITARERRERVVTQLRIFLDEPMATTRRAAWSFLDAEGDAVRHFSAYVHDDPTYRDVTRRSGSVELLRVLLWLRTVADLRDAGALDDALFVTLLEPHLRAWTGYTERMSARNLEHPDAIARGDAGLFSWRLAGPTS
jgi:hypothetical protein